jgi:transposase-like protein
MKCIYCGSSHLTALGFSVRFDVPVAARYGCNSCYRPFEVLIKETDEEDIL